MRLVQDLSQEKWDRNISSIQKLVSFVIDRRFVDKS